MDWNAFTRYLKTLLETMDYVQVRINGESMQPTLLPGEYVWIRKPRLPLKKGTVVLVASEEYIVSHRIIFTKGDRVITRGDANSNEDPPSAVSDVLAEVVFVKGPRYWWRCAVAIITRQLRLNERMSKAQ